MLESEIYQLDETFQSVSKSSANTICTLFTNRFLKKLGLQEKRKFLLTLVL